MGLPIEPLGGGRREGCIEPLFPELNARPPSDAVVGHAGLPAQKAIGIVHRQFVRRAMPWVTAARRRRCRAAPFAQRGVVPRAPGSVRPLRCPLPPLLCPHHGQLSYPPPPSAVAIDLKATAFARSSLPFSFLPPGVLQRRAEEP